MKLDCDEELFDYNGDGVLDMDERAEFENEELREMQEILYNERDSYSFTRFDSPWDNDDDML